MTLSPEIRDFLDSRDIDYQVVEHPQVFSSIEEARALGIEADEIAKTLVVQITDQPGEVGLAVIPGSQKISNKKIRDVFGTKHVRLATEDEMGREFPQFELGAVPPLGELLDLPVYVDQRLISHDSILFSGGTHTDSLKMGIEDFLNTTDTILVDLVEEAEAA